MSRSERPRASAPTWAWTSGSSSGRVPRGTLPPTSVTKASIGPRTTGIRRPASGQGRRRSGKASGHAGHGGWPRPIGSGAGRTYCPGHSGEPGAAALCSPDGAVDVVVVALEPAQPRSRTSPCSVAGITARSTRRATRSIDSPTARSRSGGRTAGPCPMSRLLRRCPPIRPRPSGRGTTRRGFASTRGRRARAGWGSAWTWAGRSTSCIPWPREVWERDDRLRRLADEPWPRWPGCGVRPHAGSREPVWTTEAVRR